MIKRFLIFSFLFLFSFVNSAFAHTHIESSSPQSNEIVTEQLKQITLTFEGKVEQSSTFTLQNADGKAFPVDNISVSENIITGSLSTPLENGEYLISWSIIGADGHVIEGEFPFTVDTPVAETNDNTENGTVDAEVTDAELNPVTETNNSEVDEDIAPNEPVDDTSSSYLVPTLIGVLILIVVGSFLFIARRKQ